MESTYVAMAEKTEAATTRLADRAMGAPTTPCRRRRTAKATTLTTAVGGPTMVKIQWVCRCDVAWVVDATAMKRRHHHAEKIATLTCEGEARPTSRDERMTGARG